MFRVGDIVERQEFDGLNLVGKQYTVVSINPHGTHITIDETGNRFLAANYKLIKPVWKIGDTARIIACERDATRIGNMFIVHRVDDEGTIYEAWNKSWTPVNLERVVLALEPPKPLIHAELKTTLAREMEIPTYLYDVVEVKPRIKPGTVQVGPCTIDIETEETNNPFIQLRNIDGFIWDAERLRKLAKLCTDLADLMG